MHGFGQRSDALFVYISPESFVPKDHPLRPIRQMVDAALDELSPVFCQMYYHTGRPSVPPEQLLKAMLLHVPYLIPSNFKLVEEIHFGILFRWFLGLGLDEQVWDHSSFSKNQEPPAGKNPTRDFRGEKLVNNTHASTTDPEARLYRKGALMRPGFRLRPMC